MTITSTTILASTTAATAAEAIGQLEARGITGAAARVVDRAQGGPAARHEARVSCLEGALSFVGSGWIAYQGGVAPAELADLAGGSYQREFLEGYHASSGSTDGARWAASRAESRRAVLDRIKASGYRVTRRKADRRMIVMIAPPVSGLAVGPVCRKAPKVRRSCGVSL